MTQYPAMTEARDGFTYQGGELAMTSEAIVPDTYRLVHVGLNGELARFKVLDQNGNYIPGALFHTEREAVDYINEGRESAQAERDNDMPISLHANVSVYGVLEMHVQLASASGLYGGNEAKGVTLDLTAYDAERLRAQLDELLTVYDRHSI